MTHDEAIGVAFAALSYALENDADYLQQDTIDEWQKALAVGGYPVAFTCWEVAFQDDPDGEPTRGLSQGLAERLHAQGALDLLYDGITCNASYEAVHTHTYRPARGHEAAVWDAMLEEDDHA